MNNNWIIDLILALLGVLIWAFVLFGIPLTIWIYIINVINISMFTKILIFILFCMFYYKLIV